MKRLILFFVLPFLLLGSSVSKQEVVLGDEQFDSYLPLLEGRRTAIYSNQSGLVGDRPLLDLNIRKLQAQGYDRFVVNIHHFAQQIVDYVAQQDYAPLVHFSDETEALLETGGGLKKAAPLFMDDEPVLIHNVDILDNVDYNWFSRQHQPDEDAVLLVSQRKTSGGR